MTLSDANHLELLRRYYADRQRRRHLDAPATRGLNNFPLTKPELREIFAACWAECEALMQSDRDALVAAAGEEVRQETREVRRTIRAQPIVDGKAQDEQEVAVLDSETVEVRRTRGLLEVQGRPEQAEPVTEACAARARARLDASGARALRDKLAVTTFGKTPRAGVGGKPLPIDQATEERRIFALVWDLFRESA